ncbi:SGNH/GDSL hydrolase family protein [Nitrobacter sp. JJSN]|uniref:SGNH/GDSL hydrolase family protein n=1 Tax=Nitrobacter sp. JJSN TaxID=3453033 RepID=UPI003F76D49E
MPGLKPLLRRLTERGPLIVLAVVATLVAAPASAQFFNFGFQQRPAHRGGGGGWFGSDNPLFAPFQQPSPRQQQQQQQQRPAENYSHAPPPEKRDTVPERNVLVLGDAMADWLAYGLEDALSETPDMGVIRKHKTISGLIRYQPKGEPADWEAAAKAILATEKPDAIVVMLGLYDRTSIRETLEKDKSGKADDKKKADADKKEVDKKDAEKTNKPDAAATAKLDDKPVDSELPPDEADGDQLTTREKSTRSPNGIAEYRSDRWAELYSRKIDEMIAVLKSKGVPVFWVGLPAVRGTKSTSDMLFLDSLYRAAADKAGITYVDIWDGFVDEAGRYVQQGPDFEGQIRRLRSYDGVYFTKAGARKLAHYVEREITRVLAARSGPVAIPTEPGTPDTDVKPGQPAPRPLAGPIVPLVASSVGTDQLLGGPGSRAAAIDALAARTLVKGEPLSAPAGRADDYVWPRREVGLEPAKADAPVATAAPHDATSAPASSSKKPRPTHSTEQARSEGSSASRPPSSAQQAQKPRTVSRPSANSGPAGFFSDLFSR